MRTGEPVRPRKFFRKNQENSQAASFCFLGEVYIQEALNGNESNEWMLAMTQEIQAILKNDIWELVDRPTDKEILGSRMVPRNKYKADGTSERKKARLVAQGFSEKPGIHFNETFAPVTRLSTISIAS